MLIRIPVIGGGFALAFLSAILAPGPARASCLDELTQPLSEQASRSERALGALEEATLAMALRLDGAIQRESDDASAIRSLRRHNCAELPQAFRSEAAGLADPLLVGSGREIAQLRRTYLFTRI